MDSTVLASIIGGLCTVVAGVGGAVISKSQFVDRIFRKSTLANFSGTKWESRWRENYGGQEKDYVEYLEFTRQRGNRVYGTITTDQFPDMRWDVEGDYNDRFLRLFWTPSKDSTNQFFVDYGCYFFERSGDGSFVGYSVGFDHERGGVHVDDHQLRRVSG